jgi:hypothetical protein
MHRDGKKMAADGGTGRRGMCDRDAEPMKVPQATQTSLPCLDPDVFWQRAANLSIDRELHYRRNDGTSPPEWLNSPARA